MNISVDSLLKNLDGRQRKILLAVLFILGLALIFFSGTGSESPKGGLELVDSENYKLSLESQLEDMLSEVSGVGRVKVMITFKGENSKTIAYNENYSVSAGSNSNREDVSKDAVLIRDGSSSVPYTLNEDYPAVEGVLVVSDGAGDSLTKSYIISAVRSTLNVSANNITVLPMSSK
ncbi:MAG: hypothetical protein IKM61_10560 [Eubacteriaceae bacterium]|nr:hypothetical protein [Eubacteriaceae bacterium]